MVTKKIKHKTADGTVIEADIGAEAKNVTEDESHMFVTEAEKQKIAKMNYVTEITLTAAGWAGSAVPYTQTVAVEGMTAECNPDLVSLLADGANEATQKAYNKAFGLVAAGTGTTGNGAVTFKVYKQPELDIIVGLKGVW